MGPLLPLPLLLACSSPTDSWWDVDVGYDGPLRFDTAAPEDTADAEEEDLSDQKVMRGDLQQTGDGAEATIRFRHVADKVILCDVQYTSTKIRQVTCEACSIAFSMILDDEDLIADNGGGCDAEGWTGQGGEAVYVGLDMEKNSYHCTEGCTDGSGAWTVAGTASFADDGFSFVIGL